MAVPQRDQAIQLGQLCRCSAGEPGSEVAFHTALHARILDVRQEQAPRRPTGRTKKLVDVPSNTSHAVMAR